MSTHRMKHECLTILENVNIDGFNLTSPCGIAYDGTSIYSIKASSLNDGIKRPILIYKMKDSILTQINVVENGQSAKLFTHANGLTYAKKKDATKGYLYVPTMNKANDFQIVKIDPETGEVKNKFYYLNKNGVKTKILALDYMGTTTDGYLKFVVKTNKFNYSLALLKGINLKAVKEFKTTSLSSNWSSNDIYYKSKKLYAIFFKRDDDNKITYNRIYEYDLNNITDGVTLSNKNIYIDNRVKTQETIRYEVESAIILNGKFYVTANRDSIDPAFHKDGVFINAET